MRGNPNLAIAKTTLRGRRGAAHVAARVYGSGAKTKHASIVILADRQYVRELQGDETEAQIFILKNRDGRTGRVKATFDIRKLRFNDVPEDENNVVSRRRPSKPA